MVKKPSKEKSLENIDHDEETGTYQCIGDFKTDYLALCQVAKLPYVPQVLPRPKPAGQANLMPVSEERIKSTRLTKKEVRSNSSRLGIEAKIQTQDFCQKSTAVKSCLSFFIPSVQVESTDQEKLDQVSEIFIRNWLVDSEMMTILHQCCSAQNKLTLMSLWRVGLNLRTLEQLSCLVNNLPGLRILQLDNNPIESQDWHLLLGENSFVQHLSLRHNCISVEGCQKLSNAISSLYQQSNVRLLSLNLSGNKVMDEGAEVLAGGLKFNTSLLFLDLSNNCIGNYGTKKLAQAISKFPMSHEEIVLRRKLIWDAMNTTDDRVEELAEEKQGQSEKVSKTQSDIKIMKDGDKARKSKKKETIEIKNEKGKMPRKFASDGKKKPDNSKDSKFDEKEDQFRGLTNIGSTEFNKEEGVLYAKGNLTLSSLNLSYNAIDEKGYCHLLNAINLQTEMLNGSQSQSVRGLIRLHLDGNMADSNSEAGKQIELIIKERNMLSNNIDSSL